MSGPVFLLIAIAGGILLYLLLRRRGEQPGESLKAMPPAAADGSTKKPAEAATDFHPVTKTSPPPPTRPTFRSGDSGSSHPAYPIAPAKYSGATAAKPGSSPRHEVANATPVSRRDVDPVLEARKAANAPPPTEPWYPQAPASYTEGEEPGPEGGAGS